MNKPNDLRVLRHVWNDGWGAYMVIGAYFDEAQAEVPAGWERVENYCGQGVLYEKTFPYGTVVVCRNGVKSIVV